MGVGHGGGAQAEGVDGRQWALSHGAGDHSGLVWLGLWTGVFFLVFFLASDGQVRLESGFHGSDSLSWCFLGVACCVPITAPFSPS